LTRRAVATAQPSNSKPARAALPAYVAAHAEAEMHKLTGGLNLPGGMKLPF